LSFNSQNFQHFGPISSGSGGLASWLVSQPLNEETTYYWDGRAVDGSAASGLTTASFFVIDTNEPPTAPTLATRPTGQSANSDTDVNCDNTTDPGWLH